MNKDIPNFSQVHLFVIIALFLWFCVYLYMYFCVPENWSKCWNKYATISEPLLFLL